MARSGLYDGCCIDYHSSLNNRLPVVVLTCDWVLSWWKWAISLLNSFLRFLEWHHELRLACCCILNCPYFVPLSGTHFNSATILPIRKSIILYMALLATKTDGSPSANRTTLRLLLLSYTHFSLQITFLSRIFSLLSD